MNKSSTVAALLVMLVASCGRVSGADPDLQIGHIEVTQVLQDDANNIPLVKGKPTIIRVFPTIPASATPVDGVDAKLHAYRNGAELPGSPLQSDNGPVQADQVANRGSAGDSLNFTLDPDWYEADTHFRAELVLPAGYTDPNLTNNSRPEASAQPMAVSFTDRKGYSIRFVRVTYTNPAGGPNQPSARVEQQSACDFLRTIFPTDPTEMIYAPFVPGVMNFSGTLSNGDLDGDALVSELNTLWLAADPADRPDRLFAWTPPNAYFSNGLSDPLWAGGQGHVCFGNDTDGRWRRTFAHEIGHNTDGSGLQHTDRRLQGEEYGFDVLGVDPSHRVVMRKYPAGDPDGNMDLYDIMRGGEMESHAWVTPPHYAALFAHLATGGDADANADGNGDAAEQASHPAQAADANQKAPNDPTATRQARAAAARRAGPKEYLVVRGRVERDGGGKFFPFYLVPATGDVDARTPEKGTHEIRFLDPNAKVLKQIQWTPDFRSDDHNEQLKSRPFTWFIEPMKGVARVELRRDGQILDALRVSAQGPKIQNLRQAPSAKADDAAIHLSWGVAAPAPADANDTRPMLHQIYFSNDDGKNWQLVASGLKDAKQDIKLDKLPGGEACRFQIRTTDGYNVDVKTTDRFSVPEKGPSVTIAAPSNGQSYKLGGGVLFLGQGYDLEDKELRSDRHTWKSDRQGVLGQGKKLVVRNLEAGRHKITLSVADKSGKEVTSQPIDVEIKER